MDVLNDIYISNITNLSGRQRIRLKSNLNTIGKDVFSATNIFLSTKVQLSEYAKFHFDETTGALNCVNIEDVLTHRVNQLINNFRIEVGNDFFKHNFDGKFRLGNFRES